MQFGRVHLAKTTYAITLDPQRLDPVPLADIERVYAAYCKYKQFDSVMPMVPGRFLVPGTEVFGYYEHNQLVAWSMYRIWDQHSVVIDHHAWDYSNPRSRLGIRSLHTECAIYKQRGFEFMYFESIAPYMLKLEGFEILGRI
jgi:hypothetical protein